MAHPAYPAGSIASVTAGLDVSKPHWLRLRWRIEGAREIVVPPFAGPARRDGLWRTTCFELFVKRPDGDGYCEFNFSPSQAFAAYAFDGYRKGMRQAHLPRPPVIYWRGGRSGLRICDVALRTDTLPRLPLRFSLACVIEQGEGEKSYWAMRHPEVKPDFHHPACFIGRLEAPGRP